MYPNKRFRNNDDNDKSFYQQNLEQQLASQQRKTAHRRTVDHGNTVGRWVLQRTRGIRKQYLGKVRPEASYLADLMPPAAYRDEFPIVDVQTKFVHLSANKARHAINTIRWTPEGRRLISANYAGEFTLWNGMTFNFETIMQAHDSAIHSLCYSHNDDWLISGDQEGVIKFWQPNFNNVNIVNAHVDAVRDLAFSPNDSRFVSCSDDRYLKIWNFNTGEEERSLKGHNWDVKCCDWHPSLGLIVSGSKDNLLKLWDPRASTCINTILGFKHNVTKTKFQPNGTQRLIASVSKDRSCRIFDLRAMKDLLIIRSHEADLSCVAWNPVHSSMVSTGGYDGSMNHYLIDSHQFDASLHDLSFGDAAAGINNNGINIDNNNMGMGMGMGNGNRNTVNQGTNKSFYQAPSIEPCHSIPYAHEKGINCLEYHPLGHLLCSAGADRSARFWCRSRPNDPGAFNDELYTNIKIGAWHYAINNNVNAVKAADSPQDAAAVAAAATAASGGNGNRDRHDENGGRLFGRGNNNSNNNNYNNNYNNNNNNNNNSNSNSNYDGGFSLPGLSGSRGDERGGLPGLGRN